MQTTADTLSKNIGAKSVAVLNRHLAATTDLHAQKQAHWNVRGPTFIAIHELFDNLADAVESYFGKGIANPIAQAWAGP